jgi:hypothetical protein
MGQVLHGSATTTHAIRSALRRSKAPVKELAARYGLNQKTVAKWRKRGFLHDAPMGPKAPRSTVLTVEEEAMVVALRRHTLLPLDDCLYALQATIPHLTRSALHRCLQRHGISRLPEVGGDKATKQPFKRYPIGYSHIDIAEVRTEEGMLHLFVAVDRTSKYAFAQLHRTANAKVAARGRGQVAELMRQPLTGRSENQRPTRDLRYLARSDIRRGVAATAHDALPRGRASEKGDACRVHF